MIPINVSLLQLEQQHTVVEAIRRSSNTQFNFDVERQTKPTPTRVHLRSAVHCLQSSKTSPRRKCNTSTTTTVHFNPAATEAYWIPNEKLRISVRAPRLEHSRRRLIPSCPDVRQFPVPGKHQQRQRNAVFLH